MEQSTYSTCAFMRILLLPTILLTDPSLALAQDKVRVRPVVTTNIPEQAVFKQCLFRELRKIPEVTVVSDAQQHVDAELRALIIEPETKGGVKLGYAAAIAEFDPLDVSWLESTLTPYGVPLSLVMSGNDPLYEAHKAEMPTKENSPDLLPTLLSDTGSLAHMWLITDNSLTSLCRRIVADFDTESVEPARQASQKLHEKLEKLSKPNSSR
jgi:hypothetical protein